MTDKLSLPEPNHITPAMVLRNDELFYSWLSALRANGIDMDEDAARVLLVAQVELDLTGPLDRHKPR